METGSPWAAPGIPQGSSPRPGLPRTNPSRRCSQAVLERRWVLLDHVASPATSTKNLITIQLRKRF